MTNDGTRTSRRDLARTQNNAAMLEKTTSLNNKDIKYIIRYKNGGMVVAVLPLNTKRIEGIPVPPGINNATPAKSIQNIAITSPIVIHEDKSFAKITCRRLFVETSEVTIVLFLMSKNMQNVVIRIANITRGIVITSRLLKIKSYALVPFDE